MTRHANWAIKLEILHRSTNRYRSKLLRRIPVLPYVKHSLRKVNIALLILLDSSTKTYLLPQ